MTRWSGLLAALIAWFACIAAAVGTLSSDGLLQSLDRLSPSVKVEGIDARLEGGTVELTMVSDADDAAIPASLYRASLPAN